MQLPILRFVLDPREPHVPLRKETVGTLHTTLASKRDEHESRATSVVFRRLDLTAFCCEFRTNAGRDGVDHGIG